MTRITETSGGVAVIPHDRIKDAARVLEAYEDTGLTPEEIIDGKLLTGWIPVKEQLPDKLENNPEFDVKRLKPYLVSAKYYDFVCVVFWNGVSFTDGCNKLDVDAWMPLPEPYKPQNLAYADNDTAQPGLQSAT